MLEIKNLQSRIGDTKSCEACRCRSMPAKYTPSWGRTVPAKARSRRSSPGTRTTRLRRLGHLHGQDLLELEPEERAREGIFLGFQYPVEIPGVNNAYLLKAALNAKRKHQGLDEIDAFEFLKLAREKMAMLGMDPKFLNRGVNEGFSGGEKKRNEILQMAMLEPELAILDETDSGLDIDALKAVANGVNALRSPDRAIVLVTHYQRLLDYIEPDFVHVLSDGQIVKSGDKSLALELEEKGYDWVREAASA